MRLDQVGNGRVIRVADSPARGQPAYPLVMADCLLQPAAAEFEERRAETRADLQQPEARLTGQPVSLPRVLQAILVAALRRLDLSDDDERVAGEVVLAGREGQIERLAAVRERLRPPARLLAQSGGPLERVGKPADGAFAARQPYRPVGVGPGPIEISGTAPGGGDIELRSARADKSGSRSSLDAARWMKKRIAYSPSPRRHARPP